MKKKIGASGNIRTALNAVGGDLHYGLTWKKRGQVEKKLSQQRFALVGVLAAAGSQEDTILSRDRHGGQRKKTGTSLKYVCKVTETIARENRAKRGGALPSAETPVLKDGQELGKGKSGVIARAERETSIRVVHWEGEIRKHHHADSSKAKYVEKRQLGE